MDRSPGSGPGSFLANASRCDDFYHRQRDVRAELDHFLIAK
jgi:hypothetical protein